MAEALTLNGYINAGLSQGTIYSKSGTLTTPLDSNQSTKIQLMHMPISDKITSLAIYLIKDTMLWVNTEYNVVGMYYVTNNGQNTYLINPIVNFSSYNQFNVYGQIIDGYCDLYIDATKNITYRVGNWNTNVLTVPAILFANI